jgi:hypothetical protein
MLMLTRVTSSLRMTMTLLDTAIPLILLAFMPVAVRTISRMSTHRASHYMLSWGT